MGRLLNIVLSAGFFANATPSDKCDKDTDCATGHYCSTVGCRATLKAGMRCDFAEAKKDTMTPCGSKSKCIGTGAQSKCLTACTKDGSECAATEYCSNDLACKPRIKEGGGCAATLFPDAVDAAYINTACEGDLTCKTNVCRMACVAGTPCPNDSAGNARWCDAGGICQAKLSLGGNCAAAEAVGSNIDEGKKACGSNTACLKADDGAGYDTGKANECWASTQCTVGAGGPASCPKGYYCLNIDNPDAGLGHAKAETCFPQLGYGVACVDVKLAKKAGSADQCADGMTCQPAAAGTRQAAQSQKCFKSCTAANASTNCTAKQYCANSGVCLNKVAAADADCTDTAGDAAGEGVIGGDKGRGYARCKEGTQCMPTTSATALKCTACAGLQCGCAKGKHWDDTAVPAACVADESWQIRSAVMTTTFTVADCKSQSELRKDEKFINALEAGMTEAIGGVAKVSVSCAKCGSGCPTTRQLAEEARRLANEDREVDLTYTVTFTSENRSKHGEVKMWKADFKTTFNTALVKWLKNEGSTGITAKSSVVKSKGSRRKGASTSNAAALGVSAISVIALFLAM